MKIITNISLVLLIITLLIGCNQTEKPNLITEIDSSEVNTRLSTLQNADAKRIRFASGSSSLNVKAAKDLLTWLTNLDSTTQIIAVQGAAGKTKYKAIGDQRQLAIIQYLREKGFESVMVDYDEKSPGGSAYLWGLDNELTQLVRNTAPSIIIYP